MARRGKSPRFISERRGYLAHTDFSKGVVAMGNIFEMLRALSHQDMKNECRFVTWQNPERDQHGFWKDWRIWNNRKFWMGTWVENLEMNGKNACMGHLEAKNYLHLFKAYFKDDDFLHLSKVCMEFSSFLIIFLVGGLNKMLLAWWLWHCYCTADYLIIPGPITELPLTEVDPGIIHVVTELIVPTFLHLDQGVGKVWL